MVTKMNLIYEDIPTAGKEKPVDIFRTTGKELYFKHPK
jgi:hypothetical protein